MQSDIINKDSKGPALRAPIPVTRSASTRAAISAIEILKGHEVVHAFAEQTVRIYPLIVLSQADYTIPGVYLADIRALIRAPYLTAADESYLKKK